MSNCVFPLDLKILVASEVWVNVLMYMCSWVDVIVLMYWPFWEYHWRKSYIFLSLTELQKFLAEVKESLEDECAGVH